MAITDDTDEPGSPRVKTAPVVDAIQVALDRARSGTNFEFYRLNSETDAQRAARLDAERDPPSAPLGEQVGAALKLESFTYGIVRNFVENAEFPDDPDYVPLSADSPSIGRSWLGRVADIMPNL